MFSVLEVIKMQIFPHKPELSVIDCFVMQLFPWQQASCESVLVVYLSLPLPCFGGFFCVHLFCVLVLISFVSRLVRVLSIIYFFLIMLKPSYLNQWFLVLHFHSSSFRSIDYHSNITLIVYIEYLNGFK